MNKKTIKILSLILIISMALSGCATKAPAPSNEPTGSNNDVAAEVKTDIVIATAADFITMDPLDTNDTLSGGLQRAIMEGLYGFDHDMNLIPLLAESYEANEDATEFTFKLRQDVKFSDGTIFNADAAIVNLNRMADQNQGLKRNSLFNIIAKSEKIDDYSIKIVLNQPFGAFVNTLAHPAALMMSPAAIEKFGKEVSQNPVGTGRYIFDSWTPGEKLVLKTNSNYWGGAPEFTSITFKPVVENGTRISMLQSGDADFIFPVPTEQIAALEKNADLTVTTIPSIITRYVTLNTAKAPLNDVKVRQALNYAIDKDALIKVVYNGYAEPAVSLIGPNVQFHSAQTPYTYDVEKAKALLAEAGYPDGFEISLWSNNNTTVVKGTQFVKQQLEAIGVKVNVENMEAGTLEQQVTGFAKGTPGDQVGVEMNYMGWSPSTGDADWGLRPLLASESFPPVSYNNSYYNSPEFDAAIQAALQTAVPEERKAAYADAQKILWEDAPMIFLSVDQTSYASRNNISGIVTLPDGSLDVSQGKIVK